MGDKGTMQARNNGQDNQLLQAGLAHHRSGRLDDAVLCYTSLLDRHPLYADALNLLGVVARQRSDLTTSERLISEALRQDSSVASYHHHLGMTYALQGRPRDAAESYRRALLLNPNDVDSMQLLASLLGKAGDWNGAMELYDQLLQREPHKAEWMYRLGHSMKQQSRIGEALPFYRQAVLLYPDSADAQFNLGKALFEAQRRSESLGCFQRVVALQPSDAEAHNYLGQILHEVGEAGQARRAYLEALRLRPDYPEALSNLGALLMEVSEMQSAEVLLRRALQIAPEFTCAATNLGSLLSRRGRFVEAFEIFRKVLQTDPNNPMVLCSLGFSLDALGDLEGARECFELALKAEHGSALARFNLSSHLLLAGNFAEGWSWYERRLELRQFTGKPRTFPQSRWRGEPLADASIFLHAEQGLGDTLQFARYALLLAERGAQVTLEVQSPLGPLLRTLHPAVHILVKGEDAIPATDWHCPLLSLPYIFGTDLSSIPATVPYLQAEAAKAKQWAERLHTHDLCVGVVWSGNPEHTRDRLRSIPSDQFFQILQPGQTRFYSLQKGLAAEQARTVGSEVGLDDLDPYLLNFTDTAAVIANLDLVITVDTAVAHLAGAMGRPVWLLLAYAPDWRWLKERSDSPWYPTARLFRQTSPGSWTDVLEKVKIALQSLACKTDANSTAERPA